LLQARASLLREVLQLLQAAHGGTLAAEIDPRPFARLLASDDADALVSTRLQGRLSLMHVLILGAPPPPADVDSWTDIAEAAQMLGQHCYRRQWSYQLEPLIELLLPYKDRTSDFVPSNSSVRLLDAPDDHGPTQHKAKPRPCKRQHACTCTP